MAGEETIGRATIELGADGSKLAPEMAAAVVKAQGQLERANRQMERAHASTMKAIQSHIDRINATRPTQEMRLLEQAVTKLGGTSKLTQGQLARVTAEVNALAAAGAKVPATLSKLTGVGSKLGAAFQSLTTGGGVSGALAAIGPAGVAAAAALGTLTLAGGAALREISALAAKAEAWSNTAKATGLGVGTVQKLQAFFEDAGIEAEILNTAMRSLHKEIADGGKDLAKYGVDLASIKEQSPEEQLQAVAQAIANISDVNERGAAAQAAFGRAGERLIPILDQVAAGGYKVIDALGDKQVAALTKTDEAFDRLSRQFTHYKDSFISGMAEMVLANEERKKRLFGIMSEPVRPGSLGTWADIARRESPSTYLDISPLSLGAETEQKAARAAYEESQKKSAKAQQEVTALLAQAADSARKLAFRLLSEATGKAPGLKTYVGIESLPAARSLGMGAMVGARNYDFGLDAQGFVTWGEQAKEATEETVTLTDRLGTLADQLHVLAQTAGGTTGKIVDVAASLTSGLGGIVQGFGQMKGAGGGLMGFLGKAAGGLGMVGSAIGVVGGLIGGIKSLFGGKSKAEKEAERQAKLEAERAKKEAERQAVIDRDRNLREGLGSAKGFAESLMDRLAEGGLSDALSNALQTLVGKVGDALLKSGLGILDSRLKESAGFQGAQGMAGDVAGLLSGMRQAGVFDAGLAAAGGAAATEIQRQAVEAAKAAGLSEAEAQKAGSAAIAQILREQLNYSVQSGKALDSNTAALLEEAKKNGIDILADPAIESLGVQKEQLGVLKEIAGDRGERGYGAAQGFGPAVTRNMGGGLGPLIQTHPDEFVWVLPKGKWRKGMVISAAEGVYREGRTREGGAGGREREDRLRSAIIGSAGAGAATADRAAVSAIAAAVKESAAPITIAPTISFAETPEGDKETRMDRRRATVDHMVWALNQRIPELMIAGKRAKFGS